MKAQLGRRVELLLGAALAAILGATFFADLVLPLGTAVWVVYLLPVALAYLASRPLVPPLLALVATALMIVGYHFAPAGVELDVARINRGFGVVTAWVIGATGFLYVRTKLAVQTQDWLQAGQVGLSRRMGGDQALGQLGENVLRFLAEYLGAQAGLFFVREGEAFRRQGAYGVPAEAQVVDGFRDGDGLLGQAAKDDRSFLLSDLPDDILYFGTGMARGKPRHLLVAPVKADGVVNAVVELGFVGPVGHDALALLERVSQSVGVEVRSAMYRGRLQELLEETQQQAEELQAQSEELQTTNQQLEERSLSLQESQSRLEQQQTELEQTNTQLEEQAQMLESQRDDLARTQADLQAQAGELELASRYKSEFVANMSHELRTPLNSLLIMARLLGDNRDGNLTAEQVRYARTVESSGNDLLALINDILDISKIEAGRLELQLHRVRILPLLDKLTAGFAEAAAQKGLVLRSEAGADAPADLETDPQRLEQVLKNFLSNAVKFTAQGEVVLHAARGGAGRIAFTVRDTGIGIEADQQQSIFDAFRQADGTINRKYGGTGLGLSISRELAWLLGGDIVVDSKPGEGSAFTLVLPETYDPALVRSRPAGATAPITAEVVPAGAAPAAPDTGPPAPAVPRRAGELVDDRECLTGDSRIILVVEDDDAFARILYDLAHELGFKCLVARTADEGVVVARRYLPHAIILDIGLPDHTGLSVLDRLKRDLRTRHIPIHVVSVADYMQTALSFGAVGYMLKPVKREALAQALEGLETRFAHRLRRVLIVEDDAAQLESLQQLLASRNVDAVGTRTAKDCLAMLSAETFDCMVLDLSLPDASGFEVLEELSGNEAFSFPPVIVYTGRDLSTDEELRLRKYSKSIIIKGAKSPDRLLDEVTLFLHQVVADLPERQQKLLAKSLNRDAALEGRCILVVEDDVRNVFSLTSILEPHGVAVLIARNGREALDMLETAATAGGRPVDLVLMDVMMPVMDGLTAIREIRSRAHWRSLPVIALTAKAMPSDQEQCLAAGASDYLAKPLDVDKLLSLVRVWMPR